jgi:hypothetical protein
MNRQVAKSVVFVLISGNAVTMPAAPVIPDYDLKKVNGKPAVTPSFNLNASGSMGLPHGREDRTWIRHGTP